MNDVINDIQAWVAVAIGLITLVSVCYTLIIKIKEANSAREVIDGLATGTELIAAEFDSLSPKLRDALDTKTFAKLSRLASGRSLKVHAKTMPMGEPARKLFEARLKSLGYGPHSKTKKGG